MIKAVVHGSSIHESSHSELQSSSHHFHDVAFSSESALLSFRAAPHRVAALQLLTIIIAFSGDQVCIPLSLLCASMSWLVPSCWLRCSWPRSQKMLDRCFVSLGQQSVTMVSWAS